MMRTSTLRGLEAPTRMISPSWSTRKSRVCMESGNSPTSSRKIVLPSAISKYPALPLLEAPVNAPGM